jgi:hypothetical protein
MTSTRPRASANLPLSLVTLPRSVKSQEIFELTSLSHVIIKVEAYRAQRGLTQCYNCQQFGHAWANCKQPPRCVWCGGGHLHRDCPEKENRESTPAYNCKLAEERPHPSNYRGCKLAREELQKRKIQKSQTKELAGRVFSSRLATPTVSFAGAVKGQQRNQPQQIQTPTATTGGADKAEKQSTEEEMEQPVQPSGTTGNNNSSSLVAKIVQQIMTGLNEAVSEEDKIITITKIVMKLINHEY